MSHTNETINYDLPQFLGTDKPSWLTDINGAFSDIDAAIFAAKSSADAAASTADSAAAAIVTLSGTVTNMGNTVSSLGSTVTTLGGTVNSITSLIGNGTPTTTDQTIIGAINELNADKANKLLKVTVTVNTNSDGIGFLSMTTEHYSVYSAFTADKLATPYIVSGSPDPYDYYWVRIEDWNHNPSANASFSVDVWCNYFD